ITPFFGLAMQAQAGLDVIQSAISNSWAGTPIQANTTAPDTNSTVANGGAGNAVAFSFTPASTFTLDSFSVVYAGGASTGFLTIYELGSGQGGRETDGFVNSQFNTRVLVTPRAFTVGGTLTEAFLNFDLTGADEVTLTAGTRYMFDFTAAVSNTTVNGSYAGVDASPDWNFFLRRGGAFDTSGSNIYGSAETGIQRNDVAGGRRDLPLAFYAAPPPTLTLAKSTPGLNLIASGNDPFGLAMVRTSSPDPNLSWQGVATPGNPVSYSFNLAQPAAQNGVNYFVFFVSGNDPGFVSAPSSSFPNFAYDTVAQLLVSKTGTGTSRAVMSYKINAPNSNGSPGLFTNLDPAFIDQGTGGILASMTAGEVTGTWKVTFTSDTDFTITAPDNTTTTGSFATTSAAQFASPLYVYFCQSPNGAANLGASGVISSVSITGVAGAFTENFADSLGNLETIGVVSTSILVTSGTPYWISWPSSAADWLPQYSNDLGLSNPWEDLTGTTINVIGTSTRQQLIDAAAIGSFSPNRGFFRLKR
ncbi:MAG: hypothetical protein ACRDBP_18525, partial [Luteolibacter sp.]